MGERKWLLPIMLFGLTLVCVRSAAAQTDPSKPVPELARIKWEAARKIFDQMWEDKKWDDVETPHLWACRLLEAQLCVSNSKEERIAAYRAHLNRMMELNKFTARLHHQKLIGNEQADMTQFFVAEAELWLVQAKQ